MFLFTLIPVFKSWLSVCVKRTQDMSWEYYSDSLSDNHNIWIGQVYQCWNVLSMLLLIGFNCWSTLRCGKCTTTDQGNCSDAVFLTMWYSTKLIVTMGSFHRQMVRIYIGKFLKDARIVEFVKCKPFNLKYHKFCKIAHHEDSWPNLWNNWVCCDIVLFLNAVPNCATGKF